MSGEPLWIFGYGSLVWRPGFPHLERRAGHIAGFARRFWQGSTDHRGVPGAPGRVVTLVPRAGAVCWGVAFRVLDAVRDEVLQGLDQRERGGFVRRSVRVQLREGEGRALRAVTWVADPDNPNYLGPAPLGEMARQVRSSRGPSGSNAEYVLRLAEALTALGLQDEHVTALAERVGGFSR